MLFNSASRVERPAVWREFNGCCNSIFEVNKLALNLPAGDADAQVLFIFASHMLDLMLFKPKCGGIMGAGPFMA